MFAKLKKKIAEEAATTPRSGVRIPRTTSKESIASMGADSGDDFVSNFNILPFIIPSRSVYFTVMQYCPIYNETFKRQLPFIHLKKILG